MHRVFHGIRFKVKRIVVVVMTTLSVFIPPHSDHGKFDLLPSDTHRLATDNEQRPRHHTHNTRTPARGRSRPTNNATATPCLSADKRLFSRTTSCVGCTHRTARYSLSATRMERLAHHTVWSNAQLQRHSTKHRPTAGCSRRRQRLSAQSHSAPHSLPPRRRQKPSTDRICRRVEQQTHIAANGTAICCGNMRIFL